MLNKYFPLLINNEALVFKSLKKLREIAESSSVKVMDPFLFIFRKIFADDVL